MSEKKMQPSRIARSSALTQSLTSTSPSSSTSSSRAQSQLCLLIFSALLLVLLLFKPAIFSQFCGRCVKRIRFVDVSLWCSFL